MDNFLERYHITKLNQDQINNLNRSVGHKEIEAVIKSHPRPYGFSTEFYQNFKEELIPILLKLFYTVEIKGTLPNSFYKATVTLISKTQLRKKIAGESPS